MKPHCKTEVTLQLRQRIWSSLLPVYSTEKYAHRRQFQVSCNLL